MNDNLRTVLNSLKVIEVIINISNIIKEEDETKYSFMVEKISQIFFKNANIPVVLNFLRIDWEDYQFVDSSMNKLVLSLIKQ